MEETVNQRVKKFIDDEFRGNKRAFSVQIGVSPTVIENIVGSRQGKPSFDVIEKMYSNANINVEWLLNGEGKMLRKPLEPSILEEHRESYNHNKTIPEGKNTSDLDLSNHQSKIAKGFLPLIPIEAVAGFGKGEVQVSEFDIYDYYEVPLFAKRGAKFLIQVSGNSMYPKYSNGDLLACKPIQSLSFVQWGKPYVLDTEQGGIVKRLYQKQDNQEVLICHSDNKEYYPAFEIPLTSIYSVAIVVGLMRSE